MSNSTHDVKNSFLYDCDDVPFDEIPPEPGRLIEKESFGGIRIRVNKDSGDTFTNLSNKFSPEKMKIDGSLKRTINTSSSRIVRSPGYDDYPKGDTLQPPRYFTDDSTPSHYHETHQSRTCYESPAEKRNCNGYGIRSCYNDGTGIKMHESRHPAPHYEDHPHHSESQLRWRPAEHNDQASHRMPERIVVPPRNSPSDRPCERPYNDERGVVFRSNAGRPLNRSNSLLQNQRISPRMDPGRNPNERNERCYAPINQENRSSHRCEQSISNTSVRKPIKKPISARLGPPVNRNRKIDSNPAQPAKKVPSDMISSKNKSAPNFIARNIASSKAPKGKQEVRRPAKMNPAQSQPTKKHNEIKKVKNNNIITKAKQRSNPARTNLSKNIALSKNLSAKASSVDTKTVPIDSPSTGNVIASLIQGILEEPDVKEMITTIAHQSLPGETSAVSSSSHLGPNDPKKLAAVADEILARANSVVDNNVSNDTSSSTFRNARPIPAPITKPVRLGMYCKSCKLEFPTSMLRDLHYKTEMHCFVNGDWWKFNPKPPDRIPRHRYPLSMFCIVCWDLIRLQSEESFTRHLSAKRHKTSLSKFSEVFGHQPLHHWCMWEDLSINFRNNFVPVPAQQKSSSLPEYVYDQRVIRK